MSLIIFCGFSVDYPLHVVQAYVQERQKGRRDPLRLCRRGQTDVNRASKQGLALRPSMREQLQFCEEQHETLPFRHLFSSVFYVSPGILSRSSELDSS